QRRSEFGPRPCLAARLAAGQEFRPFDPDRRMRSGGLYREPQMAEEGVGVHLAAVLAETQAGHESQHDAVSTVHNRHGALVTAAGEELPQMILAGQKQGAAAVSGSDLQCEQVGIAGSHREPAAEVVTVVVIAWADPHI